MEPTPSCSSVIMSCFGETNCVSDVIFSKWFFWKCSNAAILLRGPVSWGAFKLSSPAVFLRKMVFHLLSLIGEKAVGGGVCVFFQRKICQSLKDPCVGLSSPIAASGAEFKNKNKTSGKQHCTDSCYCSLLLPVWPREHIESSTKKNWVAFARFCYYSSIYAFQRRCAHSACHGCQVNRGENLGADCPPMPLFRSEARGVAWWGCEEGVARSSVTDPLQVQWRACFNSDVFCS